MKYGQKPFKKSLFQHITVISSHIFLRYGISCDHDLRVEVAKQDPVKKKFRGQKNEFKEKALHTNCE